MSKRAGTVRSALLGLLLALLGFSYSVATTTQPASHGGAASRVLELHGTVHEVECMRCGDKQTRPDAQAAMAADNAVWLAHYAAVSSLRPDGDVELPPESYASFAVPCCAACGAAALKPCVVFYGGAIAREVNEAAMTAVSAADALLVLGSTCTTWSAYRLARHVSGAGRPVGLVNYGPTRIDDMVRGRRVTHAHLSDVLREVADRLGVAMVVPSAWWTFRTAVCLGPCAKDTGSVLIR